jgi:hypothetical protein
LPAAGFNHIGVRLGYKDPAIPISKVIGREVKSLVIFKLDFDVRDNIGFTEPGGKRSD